LLHSYCGIFHYSLSWCRYVTEFAESEQASIWLSNMIILHDIITSGEKIIIIIIIIIILQNL